MAPHNPAGSKPHAFENAMFLKSLQAVMATGRCKAALGGKQRRNAPLIHLDQRNKRPSQHFCEKAGLLGTGIHIKTILATAFHGVSW
jgi:hypothetical protein